MRVNYLLLFLLTMMSGILSAQDDRIPAHQGTARTQPNIGSDEIFINGTGNDFDQYLFRDDVPNGRATYTVDITRYYSDAMQFDNQGFLTNWRDLVDKCLIPKTAQLVMRIWDVDHNAVGVPPEVDHVYVNGNLVLNPQGQPAILTSGNNTWSTWSVEIPIEFLKFPQSMGTSNVSPSQTNQIEIEIDLNDHGWAVECDWIYFHIKSPTRPIMLVHGWNSSGSTWTSFSNDYLVPDGIPYLIPNDGASDLILPRAYSINNANGISEEIQRMLNKFGVDKVNIVAHSKGGLDSRMYLRLYGGQYVENLVQIATPNHGSRVADYVLTTGGGIAYALLIGDYALLNLTTPFMETQMNYYYSGFQRIGPRSTEQSQANIYLLAGKEYIGGTAAGLLTGLELPNDWVVSVQSATLPWDCYPDSYNNLSITCRVNDGEFLYNHTSIHKKQSVYKRVMELIKKDPSKSGGGTSPNKPTPKPLILAKSIVTPLQLLMAERKLFTPNETYTKDVYIEDDSAAVFTAFTSSTDVQVHLEDPNGNIIDSTYSGYNKVSTFFFTQITFDMTALMTGVWKLVVTSGGQPTVISMEATNSTNKSIIAYPTATLSLGLPNPISAHFKDGNTPITGGQASVTIYRPDAITEQLTLVDDGTNGDTTANDGIYTGLYNPSLAGNYELITFGTTGQTTVAHKQNIMVAPSSASIVGNYNEQVIDTDGDGLYNALTIDVDIDVTNASGFVLSGVLTNASDSIIATASVVTIGANSLSVGTHTLTLYFNGLSIGDAGFDGPYKLQNLTLMDANQAADVAYLQNPYTTTAYSVTAFQQPAFRLTGNNSETPIDSDGDGKYDELQIHLEFNVGVGGTFDFNGQLVDVLGNNVAWYQENNTFLNAGLHTLTFTFDATDINEHGTQGPFIFKDLSFIDPSSGTFANFGEIYTTGMYQCHDFEGNTSNCCGLSTTINTVVPASCYETADGSVQATVTGGMGNYIYSWSHGDTLLNAATLEAGIYILTTIDSIGCFDLDTMSVLEPLPLAISIEDDPNDCDDILSTIVTGGTTPYNYNWNNGVTTAQNAMIALGDYYLTVTDANNCVIASDTFMVTVLVGDGDTTYQTMTTCDSTQIGQSIQVVADVNGCDSTIITTTVLVPTNTTNIALTTCDPAQVGTTIETLQNIYGCDSTIVTTTTLLQGSTTNLNATTCDPALVGVATQVYTGFNGCDSTVVTTTTLLQSSTTNLSTTTCDSTQVGVFTQVYTGFNGCDSTVITTTTLLPSSTTNITLTTCDPIQAGVTTQVVSNYYGCDSTIVTTTTLLPAPSLTISPNTAICIGDAVTLQIAGGVSYTWDNANTLDDATSASPTATPTTTTTYIVTAVGTNGCTAMESVEVVVNPLPTVTTSGDVLVCEGESSMLSANGGTVYSWSPMVGLSDPNIANPIVTPSGAVTYTVSVTDNFGCQNTATLMVDVAQNPVIEATGGNTLCLGQSALLLATGGISYVWPDSLGLNFGNIPNPIATPVSSTFYTVIGTDANGCKGTDSVYVQVLQTEIPTLNVVGDSLIGTGIVNPTYYRWFLNGVPIFGAHDSIYVTLESGQYIVEITDSNGCSTLSIPYDHIYQGTSTNIIKLVDLAVQPNPAYDYLDVQFKMPKTASLRISISDLGGKVIYQEHYGTYNDIYNNRLDLNQLSNGMYILQIIIDGEVISKKFIVTK